MNMNVNYNFNIKKAHLCWGSVKYYTCSRGTQNMNTKVKNKVTEI